MTDTTGERIKRAIKSAGLTQKQAAAAIGVTPQSVNKWIKDGKISRDHMMDLSRATGSTFTWLAAGEGVQLHQMAETFYRVMAENGVLHAQVMDDLGIAPQTLLQWIGEVQAEDLEQLTDTLAAALGAAPEFIGRVLYQIMQDRSARERAQYGGQLANWRTPVTGELHLGGDALWHELVEIESLNVDARTGDPTAYGLLVKGGALAPAIGNGWVIVVEPGKEPQPGEYAILTGRDDKCMVCELLYRRRGEVSVSGITEAQQRSSIASDEIRHIRHVGALLPPSAISRS